MEISAADAHTTAIMEAANGFPATLSDAQTKAVVFDFTDAAQRVNWSNLPLGASGANRPGVRCGGMDEEQRAASRACAAVSSVPLCR